MDVIKSHMHKIFGIGGCEILATCSLIAYLIYSIVFRITTLSMTYPIVRQVDMRGTFELIVLSLTSFAIFIGRWRPAPKQFALSLASLIVLGLSALRTYDFGLLLGFLVLLACSRCDLKRLFRVYYYTVILTLVLVLFAGMAGFLYNRVHILNGRITSPWGITHPNDIGALLYSALGAMALEGLGKRRMIWSIMLVGCAGAFCVLVLNSEGSGVVLAALFLLLVVVNCRRSTWPNRMSDRMTLGLLVLVPLVVVVCVCFVTTRYDSDSWFFSPVDRLLHHRPILSNAYYLNNGGFTLFGRSYNYQSEYLNGTAFTNLDCAYSQLLMVYGLASIVVFAWGYYEVAAYIVHEQQGAARFLGAGFVVIYCFYALMEVFPIYLFSNSCMLFLSPVLADISKSGYEHGGIYQRES